MIQIFRFIIKISSLNILKIKIIHNLITDIDKNFTLTVDILIDKY